MLSFFVCFVVLSQTAQFVHTDDAVYDSFYEELVLKLLNEQCNKTTKYIPSLDIYPPLQWAKLKGLFSSDIHMNDVGRFSYLRNTHQWIAHILWEIRALNITDSINQETNLRVNYAINDAVNALQWFRNQNNDKNHLSLSFWKQSDKNRCNYYCAEEENLKHEISEIDAYILYLSAIAAENGFNLTEILRVDYIDFYVTLMFDESFGIPSDFDDTSVALALTTFYKENVNQFTNASDLWLSYGFTANIDSFIKDLLKYNYKPFSNDINSNYIDSRTYYWLRHFLDESIENNDIGNADKLIFVATWQLTHDENEYNFVHHICYQEPFGTNNVDPTVGANVIFAITRSLIWFGSDREQWFDQEVQQIYTNTTNLLLWIIESDFINERPDLIFLYYPSRYDFYWFVSRTYNVYHNYIINNSENEHIIDQYPFLFDIYVNLENVLQIYATKQILDKVKHDENNGYYFWDDFLGNDDLNIEGHSDPHYDDRLFSTSMAINTLLNIWTDCHVMYDDNNKQYVVTDIRWNNNTSNQVKEVIGGAVLFLRHESLDSKYRADNAFFSGSQKTNETAPWNYPINYFQTRNGTTLNATNVTFDDLVPGISLGITGYIDKATYQQMVFAGSITGKVPDQFYGYNMVGRPWPFWSSHSITYASTLLAVGTFDKLN